MKILTKKQADIIVRELEIEIHEFLEILKEHLENNLENETLKETIEAFETLVAISEENE